MKKKVIQFSKIKYIWPKAYTIELHNRGLKSKIAQRFTIIWIRKVMKQCLGKARFLPKDINAKIFQLHK